MTSRLRRAYERAALDEDRARSVVACVAIIIAARLAGLAWGDTALHVVYGAALVWLTWDRATLAERLDQAWDTADQALSRIQAVEDHLTGLEPEGTGRHASGQEQTYRPLRTAPEPPPAAAA